LKVNTIILTLHCDMWYQPLPSSAIQLH